MSTPPKRH